jgi:hypothetical protein
MKTASPEAVLTRVIEGLEPDLVNATDEDVTQAARDLGMDLSMKGSAAFMGLKPPFKLSLSEFFDLSTLDAEQLAALRRVYEERIGGVRKKLRAKGESRPRGEPKDTDKT